MPIKAVLFDLDGTLLPMDQDEFVNSYFGLIAKKLSAYGYEPKELINAIWTGTKAMIKNDGSKLNEEAFWDKFVEIYGEDCLKDQTHFEEYYHNEFQYVKDICGFNPLASEAVRRIKAAGMRVALATNPIFPAIATESRIRWAGLEPSDFEIYTTYENIGSCKPNPEYYLEVCRRLDVSPEECLMVGNDVDDDMVTADLGMQTFLITDCLINLSGKDISQYPNGTFSDLIEYLGV